MFGSFFAVAQYAPQQGLPGSTAISATSGVFVRWATGCTLRRGYIRIDSPLLGVTSYGDSSMAIGAVDHSVVSLGDSGVADLTFPGMIYDGPGADFAVFENGFINPANDSQAYLELAFVEVSSDGIYYTRFPAQSLTQTNTQIAGSGQYMYANQLNNLAGKYGAGYGTPFDLSELAGAPNLDINNITHVRIVDVVGSISGHSTHDSSGRIINDPFPTNFPTGGFDLDAVGVIHHLGTANVTAIANDITLSTYPNPVSDKLFFDIKGLADGFSATITSISGVVVYQSKSLGERNKVDMELFPTGMYYLILQDANGSKWVAKVIKR
ncbi:T9SS type A sorting domain-containing protein [Flavipsychrobacter stenotrophus]|uniref:T9SS type A sorting domain-containing protein n=1 Tax=Flavipsychrobacter stenotrophus TaxID=2077091 RepID=UPI00196B9963|nr:T9SS type A sorting domain-containing protein [Flavipsychrobacter stenotrophus]